MLMLRRVNPGHRSVALACVLALVGGALSTATQAQDTATPWETSPPVVPSAQSKTGTPAPEPEKVWTPAAYINSRLPHWLHLSGQFRNRDEAPTAYSFKPGNNDTYA